MTYMVEFYEHGVKLAIGIADTSNRISNIKPVEGRGLSYNRYIQVTVADGKHTGASLIARVKGEADNVVTLFEPMPFQETK
jgi:hypothetical protein